MHPTSLGLLHPLFALAQAGQFRSLVEARAFAAIGAALVALGGRGAPGIDALFWFTACLAYVRDGKVTRR